MTIRDIYKYAVELLHDKEEKYIDTEILLSYVLKKDRLYIKLNLDEDITSDQEEQIKKNLLLLKDDMPIHYITGIRDFYSNDFFVEKNVLIPRSDTEILVDESIGILKKSFDDSYDLNGLEIGLGSGIISISLLKNIKNLKMTAVDINPDAIKLGRKNAEKLGVEKNINIIYSDIFENVRGKFDFIISNPPYIDLNQMKTLPEKVRKYEPRTALEAEDDGLYFYDSIIKNSKKFLKEKHLIMFEIGYDQKKSVRNLFEKYEMNGYITDIKDLNGLDRVIIYRNFEV